MTAIRAILEPEQKSYCTLIEHLRYNKRELDHIKGRIDKTTGSLAPFWNLLRKDKSDLRELVETEIVLLGELSKTMRRMATQYGGERERMLLYFDTLATRLEAGRNYQPAQLAPLEESCDAVALLKSMRQRMDHAFHDSVQKRLALTERNTKQYAEEAVRLIEQCQAAHALFLTVADTMQYEYEHLQATGPVHVSLIELAETSKVVGRAMIDVRETSNTMHNTVNRGYAQVLGLVQQHRVPVLQGNSRKIELLGA